MQHFRQLLGDKQTSPSIWRSSRDHHGMLQLPHVPNPTSLALSSSPVPGELAACGLELLVVGIATPEALALLSGLGDEVIVAVPAGIARAWREERLFIITIYARSRGTVRTAPLCRRSPPPRRPERP